MYTIEYYSAMIKNETMPSAATWMDQEIVVLSEVRQKKKNMHDTAYMQKKWYKGTYKTERPTDSETELIRGWGRYILGVWGWQVHSAVFKMDNQKKKNK